VLATGPGIPPAVRILANGSVQSVSGPGQKRDLLCLGGVVTRTGHKPTCFWLGWNRHTVPYYGFYSFHRSLAPIMFLGPD